MKKIFGILSLLLFFAVGMKAQTAVQTSNVFDNVSVGVTAGVATPLDFNSVFPLNTVVGLRVQKDFTPAFGLQLEGLAFLNDNNNQFISFSKNTIKATNVGVNTVFNLSNIFKGYKGTPRTFEISAVAGIGWLHEWQTRDNFMSAKTGLDLAFNLGKKKAHSIVITPAVYWNLNKVGHIHFDKHLSQLAITATYVYHFKTSNGTHSFKTYDVGAMNDEINRLNGALEECEKREPKVVEKIIVKEVPATNTATVKAGNESWVVTFTTGSATLSNEAKFILNQIGNDAIVDVTATASPDGSEKFNQKLSEKRAKTVADFLTNRGVKVNSAIGKGVDAETGRSAIVKPVK